MTLDIDPDSRPIHLISHCSELVLVWGFLESDSKMEINVRGLTKGNESMGRGAWEG